MRLGRRDPLPPARPARPPPRSARRPRLPCRASRRASARYRARCGFRSPPPRRRSPRQAKRHRRSRPSTLSPCSTPEVQRQLRERTGVADELNLSRRDCVHALDVPTRQAGVGAIQPHRRTSSTGCRPVPWPLAPESESLRRVRRWSAGRGRRAAGREAGRSRRRREVRRRGRSPGRRPVGDLARGCPQRPMQSGRSRVRAPRRATRGAARRSTATGEHPTEARGERNLAAQQIYPGALELVEPPGLRRGHQPERRIERAGLKARLGGSQRALRTPSRLDAQRDGALQERCRGGDPAASLRSAGGPLELGGDLFVGAWCRPGAVPGAPVRVVSASVASASADARGGGRRR